MAGHSVNPASSRARRQSESVQPAMGLGDFDDNDDAGGWEDDNNGGDGKRMDNYGAGTGGSAHVSDNGTQQQVLDKLMRKWGIFRLQPLF